MSCRVISVTNQKGGVGKTTTVANLAVALGIFKKRVLVVDFDPQGNLTFGFGRKDSAAVADIYKAILNQQSIKSCILKNVANNVDLIPSTINLAAFDIDQAKMKREFENPLQSKIKMIADNYDYILIDCPPSLGLLNRNALASSHSVIIPIQAEFFALEGLTQLFSTIRLVQKYMKNPELIIKGILITMYDARLNISKEVLWHIQKHFREKLFKTIIPRNVALSEAPSHGLSGVDYRKKSKGALAYKELAAEIMKQEKAKNG